MSGSGAAPGPFRALRAGIDERYNITQYQNETRVDWAREMDGYEQWVGKASAQVGYFVGCVASFYPACTSVARATVEILQHVGADFAVLGGEEWCCGSPLLLAGMRDGVRRLVAHNMDRMDALGIETLVTTCPACHHVWQHSYPEILGRETPFRVLHASEWLADLIDSAELTLAWKGEPMTVTYHDPCDLGRVNGIYDPPRRVLQAIAGLSLVEMARNREDALCCGGGGDLQVFDLALVEKMGQRKLEMAVETGADIIASACQQCKRQMASAARRDKVRVRVMDVVELASRSLP